MGVLLSKGADVGFVSDPLLVVYRTVTLCEVRESYTILKDVHKQKHSVNRNEFDEIFGLWMGDSDPHFSFWANRKGKVDCFEIFGGTIIYSDGSLKDKIAFVFEFFDFDCSNTVTLDELTIMMMSCLRGMRRLAKLNFLLASDYVVEIEEVARDAFISMDVTKSKEISKDEFVTWVTSNEAIMTYIEVYAGGTNIIRAVKVKNTILTECEGYFRDHADEVNSISKKEMLHLVTSIIKEPTNEEMEEISRSFGHERILLPLFRNFISALVAFDLVDMDHSRTLNVKELRALLWLMKGREPNPKLVDLEMKQIDSDNSGDISRVEFVRYMSLDPQVRANVQILDTDLKSKFDAMDEMHVGYLNYTQFEQMILESIKCQVHAQITEFGQSMLVSMAKDSARELAKLIDNTNSGTIQWTWLKGFSRDICDKQLEIISFLNDYETDHVDRMLSYDWNNSNSIELPELGSMLMDKLKIYVKYGQLKEAAAKSISLEYGSKILSSIGLNDTGSLTWNDMKNHAPRVVEIENEMIDYVTKLIDSRAGPGRKSLNSKSLGIEEDTKKTRTRSIHSQSSKLYSDEN